MASIPPDLPEGTDSVLDTNTDSPVVSTSSTGDADAGGYARKAGQRILSEATSLRDQATGKARDYAREGKDKAIGTLNEVARAMEEASASVDERLGEDYGEYARMAASAVSSFASKIEAKDVDELIKDAESMVRKSPAVAIGVAAVAGFAIARLIKSGLSDGEDITPSSGAATTGTGTGNSTSA